MSVLKFTLSGFKETARKLEALERQIPFAMAVTLNNAAENTRRYLADDFWPRHLEVRNRNAMRAALTLKGNRATKARLRVAITDAGPAGPRLGLLAHARGGVKKAKGRRLAIPPKGTVRRGARGVPKGQRPAAIIAKTPKRALRVTKDAIFVGQGGRLRMKYVFKPQTRIKLDLPIYPEFKRIMRTEIKREFPKALAFAMSTARLKRTK